SRQSARRLAKRKASRKSASFSLSQSFSAGTSASVCSNQYTFIQRTAKLCGNRELVFRSCVSGFLHSGNAAFDRMNEIRTQVFGWNNVIESAHVESALYAVHAVKLSRHFAQLLGVHDFEKLVKLSAQAAFLSAVSFRQRLAQRLQARVFLGSGFDLTGKNHGCRWSTADHRGIGSLQRHHLDVFIQRP